MNKNAAGESPSCESDPTELLQKIVEILSRAVEPIPIQEIADKLGRPYADILRYIINDDKTRPCDFFLLADGKSAVKYKTHHSR